MPRSNIGIVASSFSVVPIIATGGSITNHNGYRVHTFTSSGIFSISSGLDTVEYDLLASGGGGGCDHNGSGGGGAGGRIRGSFVGRQNVYTVVIGAAGTGGPSHFSPGTSASTSSISGIPVLYTEAYGGGRGGAYANPGFNGGCGGGGGFYQPGGTGSQGFNGAWGYLYSGGGGGGQGSDGVAGSAAGFPTYSGAGGTGANVPDPSWLPSVVSRGGGGAGGGGDYGGSSSSGGGIGRGWLDPTFIGGNGLANYGAGGGGGRDVGGNGGSGICYFRYKIY